MGDLIDLKEYRAWKAEQEHGKEMDEALDTIQELEMLQAILESFIKDLPDVDTSIMYTPIEPKMDTFLNKNTGSLDGYLNDLDYLLKEDDYDNEED
jgi:hypothetical protein